MGTGDAKRFSHFASLDLEEEVSPIATKVNSYKGYFHAVMVRLDRVIDENTNGNKLKDHLLNSRR